MGTKKHRKGDEGGKRECHPVSLVGKRVQKRGELRSAKKVGGVERGATIQKNVGDGIGRREKKNEDMNRTSDCATVGK